MDTKVIFCFFGFYRNGEQFSYNIDIKKYRNYIFMPNIINEDKSDEIITEGKLLEKFGSNSIIKLYDYNKQIFIDRVEKLNIPKFNKWYQQAYRIFSFFYNVKGVLDMLPNLDPNTTIILCRSDIGLDIHDFSKIKELLKMYNIILGIKPDKTGTDDKWFVCKYKDINVFKKLYDSYDDYLRMYYSDTSDIKPPSTRPEDIFTFHFQQNNKKVVYTFNKIITYHFKHVCSKYCGHHGTNTET